MDPDQIAGEIKELRHGRGTDAEDLPERIGPGLKLICRITGADDTATVRRKVVLALTDVLGQLPADLAIAASWALALEEESREPFLGKRIEWLAQRFDRDPRTVRRYIDTAFRFMARLLVEGRSPGPDAVSAPRDSWQVITLRSVLHLDVDPPELVEVRRIMATTDNLDELELAVSAPRIQGALDELQIEMVAVYGGDIVKRVDITGEHTRFFLRLPEPLRFGQHYDYSVHITSWERDTMRPYYLLTPLRPTGSFALRVVFDRDRLPARIWKVNGMPPPWAVVDAEPTDDLLEPDDLGEVSVEFGELRGGLSYGVQWIP